MKMLILLRNTVCVLFATLALNGCAPKVTNMPDSSETMANWQTARNFQAQGRLELARQYYVVALATARSTESQFTLKREIEATDRMIQAMR